MWIHFVVVANAHERGRYDTPMHGADKHMSLVKRVESFSEVVGALIAHQSGLERKESREHATEAK